jgi:hypothetical protein
MYILTTKQERFNIQQALCSCKTFRTVLWPNYPGVTKRRSSVITQGFYKIVRRSEFAHGLVRRFANSL